MTGFLGQNTKHNFVLLIRDADTVASALRQALAEAAPEERAGLERAVALVGSYADDTDPQLRARWVRSRLAAVGYTGDVDSASAVKALRRAEPQLSLLAAAELQRDAVAHPE
ncbi:MULTISPECIES: hypothetical protein [unclassified Streptomyces]|uniref:hypothetical protein n=1 Tax=unclassified Streptomyces TaxID=2593676 RepID=UPI00248207EA|nr:MULTISPECIES: hypothetical protein [unclassified Streptomyces]MDA5285942.1 hypothetical protein [Streptomyces sp. Isolate_45]MDX2395074.1 hypothetical protein [Streptomyces sp. DK15]